MSDAPNIDRDLKTLEAELRRLEAEYNMYFAGRLPRPPVETRRRVTGLVRQLDRQRLSNYAERFRFTTLQTRFQTFVDLWDRGHALARRRTAGAVCLASVARQGHGHIRRARGRRAREEVWRGRRVGEELPLAPGRSQAPAG